MTTPLIFLSGPPNSGKSVTSYALIRAKWARYVITPGHWLRHQLATCDQQHNDLGMYIKNNWNNNVLEPLVEQHVEEQMTRLLEHSGDERPVIIEGYPRTLNEARHCAHWAKLHPVAIVMFDVPAAVIMERGARRKRDGHASLETRLQYWRNIAADICGAVPTQLVHTLRVTATSTPDEVCAWICALEPAQLEPDVPLEEPVHEERAPLPSSQLVQANALESATIVQMQLRLARCVKRKRQFCGSHPVSLDRHNMPRLLRYPYLCALKIDGMRLFCLVRDSTLWFMNRKLNVWRGVTDPFLEQFNDTLLDGEMALDDLFVVIDVLCVAGRDVSQRPIIERLSHSVPIGRAFYNAELRFRPQEYVDRTQLQNILERAHEKEFKVDGLIFQPAKVPARLGIDYNLFKWKPAEQNTVDLVWGEDGRLYTRKTSENTRVDESATMDTASGIMLIEISTGTLHPDFTQVAWLRPGLVVECAPTLLNDTQEIAWVPRQPRHDKVFPNLDWVADNIIESIRDNISEEELILHCQLPPVAPSSVPSPPRIPRSQRLRL